MQIASSFGALRLYCVLSLVLKRLDGSNGCVSRMRINAVIEAGIYPAFFVPIGGQVLLLY